MMRHALFIFRRDLRLHDNRGLISALKAAEKVILAFIFTPEQIKQNPYKSNRCLQFMIESLEELEEEIAAHKGKLYLFYGHPEEIVAECIENLAVEGVFVNRDYTPYSIQRDKKIRAVCEKKSVYFQADDDLLLHPIAETLKSDGKPYTVFTPFYRHTSRFEVAEPEEHFDPHFYSRPIEFASQKTIYKEILPVRAIQAPGGRKECLKILKKIGAFSHYSTERNFPAEDKTTRLSPHLKFTTCSIREVYHTFLEHFGDDSDLIRSLYWRDFFTLIAFHFPHVFEGAFKTKYNRIGWENNNEYFRLWCEGKTGFPIVDAGMRELNETGFMHNRVRMITANLLVKDLHIDWREGEKYFARHLIDYDPAVNNGNWQWAAGTGCDAQPYFRIFNPWLQAKKFDPECVYIKTWVPELASLPPKIIHVLYLEKYRDLCKKYPAPIVDHSDRSKSAIDLYRKNLDD